MNRRRTPTEYTTEELLNSLETVEPISDQEELIIYPDLKTDIPAFLSTYEIQPGDDVVPQRTVFELYKAWSRDPVTKDVFENEMGKYVLTHTKKSKPYYLLNQKALKLSKAAYDFVLERSVDRTKSPIWKQHFDSFIAKYGIKPGNYYLESFVLYDLYDQYVYKIKKKAPLGEIQFFNFCMLYFPNARLTENKVKWFGVDGSIKQFITDERLKQLRESRVNNAKKPKAKNKKK